MIASMRTRSWGCRAPAALPRCGQCGTRSAAQALPLGIMLITAAAQRWHVDPASCRAENGDVVNMRTGQRLAYGALVDSAARLPVPTDVPLKDPKDFKLIGTPAKRLDTPDKVNGKAQFGIDVKIPGMKIATVAACPVFGGKLAQRRRQRGTGDPGRQSGRTPRRRCRGGRRAYVGGAARARGARYRLGRRAAREGLECRDPAPNGGRLTEIRRRRSQGGRCRQGNGRRHNQNSKRFTRHRSSRMRQWSR